MNDSYPPGPGPTAYVSYMMIINLLARFAQCTTTHEIRDEDTYFEKIFERDHRSADKAMPF